MIGDNLFNFKSRSALTLSQRRSLSHRKESIDLQKSKSMDWFLYDGDFRHERVKLNCAAIENKHRPPTSS